MTKQTPEGVIINVRVVPNSKQFAVNIDEAGNIKIKLKNKAMEGKANQELVRELGKRLSAEVKIISGHKTRRKTILVANDIESVKKLIR